LNPILTGDITIFAFESIALVETSIEKLGNTLGVMIADLMGVDGLA
jgi:hypothetical protein